MSDQQARVLIVDDDRNIRLTLRHALESLNLDLQEAADGEEALRKVRAGGTDLVLLDLRLPGMDGIEVLRQARGADAEITVLIMTAHGTVENAVEAMKLGAIEFVRKPFPPEEIRALVRKALDRRASRADSLVAPASAPDYPTCVQRAKAAIELTRFPEAALWASRALGADPTQAEAHNLLGALRDISGDRLGAQKHYRAALALDPTYEPARNNLQNSTRMEVSSGVDLGDAPDRGQSKRR